MPGKGSTTTSKQESNPWAPTVDAMKSQIGQLGQVATKDAFTPQYSSATMQGIGMLENVAGQKGVGDAAAGYVQSNFGNAQGGVDTLTAASRGDNLNGNPYLQKALDSQYGNIQNRIAEQFSGGGRLGSGMQQTLRWPWSMVSVIALTSSAPMLWRRFSSRMASIELCVA